MRRALGGAVVAAGLAFAVVLVLRARSVPVAPPAPPAVLNLKPATPPPLGVPPLDGLDLTRIALGDDGATAPAALHRVAHLTLDSGLQRAATRLMTGHHLPEAAIVLLDVATGHVLAYASHLEHGDARDLCAEATAPSASVFKIVTGAALVEDAGLSPDTRQCYSGGEQKILPSDLEDDERRDRWCTTLAGAMGHSTNAVFARLALRDLKRATLEAMADKLGYEEPVPFDVPVQASALHLPSDDLGFARTAAGFWNSTLSPVQAAWLSATVARGGEAPRLSIVSEVADDKGGSLYAAPEPAVLRRAMQRETAQALTRMMEVTVAEGTSYRAFHDGHGLSFLPGITVAGKTGTLTDAQSRRFYTWFTGFAPSRPLATPTPARIPQVAVAVLVVNEPTWHVKANVLAREMLREYFARENLPGVTAPSARVETGSIARRGHADASD
jgi:cell division protein FtsI/penicillin-binding protein 2